MKACVLKKTLFILLLFSVTVWALPSGIESAIGKSGIDKKDISIYIKEAGKGSCVVASLNANRLRTPASVIKVLTTYAAVLKLGFDYRWPTVFYSRGRIANGVLHGDLIIKGYGDPTLSDEDLPKIISRIKAAGIERITGDIVIDRSYFKVGSRNTSGFDNHPYSPYNAMPDAMMFNERVSTICVIPKLNSVTKKTPDQSFVVHNQLQHVNRPCRGRYSWPHVKIDDSKAVPEVWLKGKISKRCGKREICQVLTKPYQSFYYALKAALGEEGITVGGRLRLHPLPKGAKVLFTHYSASLEKIVSKTAKKSNNLYARHLLLLLGAKMYGAPATVAKGRKAVRIILRANGALGTSLPHIDNGCGLSRTSKITAKILASVLDNAYSRYGMRWMQTLSIAGRDGTIKKRFRGTVVRNRAWMKTGTLKHVKNIAGYVKSRNGRYYTAVILVNSKHARWKAAKMQDAIITWLVHYQKRGSATAQKPKAFVPETKTVHKSKPETRFAQPAPKDAHGRYYIQTGSFKHYPKAFYLQKLKKASLPYRIVPGKEFKVLTGPYATEVRAREALAKVRDSVDRGAFLTTKEKLDEEGARLY
ncbi:D-alanyl-D-alanine carboxypeptidase [hydrothermal vent metagenome]|uniref:D-alanyl-D-alanine carboxypeptidase n=1 Tax=hydrothermal vent metagenome TaxID=652676 RepID=A0A1W1E8I5_9ZZZZ